jgi:N-acetylneuraminate synthase
MGRTYIIAEAGVNHNGSIKFAKQLIEAASNAGADAIKFQTFKAAEIVTREAKKANYQIVNTENNESQFEMLKRLEFSAEIHSELKKYAENIGIDFLSTPFDLQSIDLLNNLEIKILKVPSGEITNAPYLVKIAKSKKPVFLSTGMSTLGEIEQALEFLAFGYISEKTNKHPNLQKVKNAYMSDAGQIALKDNVTILHATTEYPAPYFSVNLNAMLTIKEAFKLKVGYSDHTEGIHVSLAAVALGADVIEKHITLDKNLPGPDHKASIEPIEFNNLVKGIRDIEMAKGSGLKFPHLAEIDNIKIARKSLVAQRPIRKGEMFSEENLGVKRPGNGISPLNYYNYLGNVATKDYNIDELINE